MARFEVVIPYFQRDPGHLLRAVQSVFLQGIEDIRVNVVDDGSPLPAEVDLAKLAEQDRARVNLIVQKNTGANGARNRGLQEIGPDVAFVAFLDSDDAWLEGHLRRAENALSQKGATFFYDTIRIDPKFAESYGEPAKVIETAMLAPTPTDPNLMEIVNPLRVLSGEWYRHMHLSVSVLSGDLARTVRFDPYFTIADDFEFFFRCACTKGRWFIDARNGAERGTGANIWHGIKTTDLRYSQEKYFSMVVLSRLRRQPGADAQTRRSAAERITTYREQFYWAQQDRLKAGLGLTWSLWVRFILRDPAILALSLKHVAGSGLRRFSN